MTARVGVVGYGEAGSAVAEGLVRAGVAVVAFDTRLDGPDGDGLRARAAAAGVVLAGDLPGVTTASEVVLSLVTAATALEVAEDLAAHLTPAHLVADLNSTSPGLARAIGEAIGRSGAAFADVAVMAAVPPNGHHVPLLASGPGAARLAASGLDLRVEVVGDQPGTASAVKMLRSLLVKGLEALLVEFGVAADRFGATEQVLRSLDGTLPVDGWRELATYLLTRTAQHGARRGHELEEVAATLREIGVEPLMAEAGARRLLWAAERGLTGRFAGEAPRSYQDVLTALGQDPA